MNVWPYLPVEAPQLYNRSQLRLQLLYTLSKATNKIAMTYEEFLDWADEDTLAEWVDGSVIMTSPASLDHQMIGQFLVKTLEEYVIWQQLGTIVSPPFQMRLAHSGREPDVIFVATAHSSRLRKTYLNGPADLVVEVISPESKHRDRVKKYEEYQEAGIPEYWLIDPFAQSAEFYQLQKSGTYALAPPDDQGIYHSPTISGFWLKVEWLWQRPDINDVLLEVGGEPFDRILQDKMTKQRQKRKAQKKMKGNS